MILTTEAERGALARATTVIAKALDDAGFDVHETEDFIGNGLVLWVTREDAELLVNVAVK